MWFFLFRSCRFFPCCVTGRANDTLGPEYPSSETETAIDDGADSPRLELFYTKDVSVPKMDAPSGVVNAPTGSQTERIIAAILEDVSTKWIITAHGKLHSSLTNSSWSPKTNL
jgi:hypothetical protein